MDVHSTATDGQVSGLVAQLDDALDLFSLPDLYLRLKAVLEDPDFALEDLAAVIRQDPGMTARLLRMVNSPFFGLGVEIDTVSRAAGLLGAQRVHDLVLATSVADSFAGMSSALMDMDTFWRFSVERAVVCRVLAAQCDIPDAERVFVAGLLSDIGHLVMYQRLPDLAQRALHRSHLECRALYRVERELMGVDYARLGGILLDKWSLPRSLVEPVEYQIEPYHAQSFALETAIVHIARFIASETSPHAQDESELLAVDPLAWRITGLSAEACGSIRDEAGPQVGAVLNLIAPRTAASEHRAAG